MKKITIPTLLVALSASLFSCTKDSELTEQNENAVKSSAWFPVSLQLITSTPTTRNSVFLTGQRPMTEFSSNAPDGYTVVAFTKYPSHTTTNDADPTTYRYAQLPAIIKTQDENSDMRFENTAGIFSVNIFNADLPSKAVGSDQFQGYRFRYILVPNSIYNKLSVNWSDYKAVVAALSLSL